MSNDTPFPISVALTSEDIKKSIKFYRDKLGFVLAGTFPNEKKPVWANLLLNGQSIMLGQAMSPKDMKKQCAEDKKAGEFWADHARRFQRGSHGVGACIYLHVADVDLYQKALKSKRVKADLAPKTQFYGLREMVVTDPDGYTLIFYSQVQVETPPAAAEASIAETAPALEIEIGES